MNNNINGASNKNVIANNDNEISDEVKINFQPYKIKICENLNISTKKQRMNWIQNANYNLFNLKSEEVIIDLLTDSGTGALSTNQSEYLISGDESYAGAKSFFHFKETIQDLTGFKHIFPTHQGRAAERILFTILKGENKIIPNNTHFDTTRANVEYNDIKAVDYVIEEAKNTDLILPFKGNMDLNKLENLLSEKSELVPIIMLTLTNNAGGGQPVSMENVKEVKKICQKYNKPLFMDGCRFAENCYFIKKRETGYENKTIEEIAKELFSYFDGMTMSAKKDAISHIGRWLALNDDELAGKMEQLLIITEGFRTYGGLAGRDLDIIAEGIKDVLNEEYLRHRIESIQKLSDKLTEIGVSVVRPSGGHAIFVDAKRFLPHIPPKEFAGHALAIELYIEGGIRSCEIGSLMFGGEDEQKLAPMELLRMAIPRRMYTDDQLNHIVEVFKKLVRTKDNIVGYEILKQPKFLRHFSAHLSPKYN